MSLKGEIQTSKLIAVVGQIISAEQDKNDLLTIYTRFESDGHWSPNSATIVTLQNEDGTFPDWLFEAGFRYFLETFIVREVVEDWEEVLKDHPIPQKRATLQQLTDVLIHYAMFDAFPALPDGR